VGEYYDKLSKFSENKKLIHNIPHFKRAIEYIGELEQQNAELVEVLEEIRCDLLNCTFPDGIKIHVAKRRVMEALAKQEVKG
jgi:hypothetical protein